LVVNSQESLKRWLFRKLLEENRNRFFRQTDRVLLCLFRSSPPIPNLDTYRFVGKRPLKHMACTCEVKSSRISPKSS
jgi:hypothetical protein